MNRSAFLVLCALQGVLLAQAEAAESRTGTLKDVRGRDIVIETDTAVEVAPEEVIRQYERVLKLETADPRLQAEALRRLGDLKLEVDEAERGEGLAAVDPTRLREAISIYERLLESHPAAPRNDMVTYQLARAHEATGNPDRALAVLDRLVTQYPASQWFAEGQFRRGEILFSQGRYGDAERAYAALTVLQVRTAFYEQALYKRGWSLFKQARSDESTAEFMRLLDLVLDNQGQLRVRDSLGRAERELTDDALRALSVTFADLDGPASLTAVLTKRTEPVYSHLLYAALGDLYLEKERYQDAALAYAAFAQRRPDDRYSPSLQVRAIDAYAQGGFGSLVLEGKQDFVERYALNSAFWSTRMPADAPEVIEQLQANLKDLAQHYHAAAQKSKAADDYLQAARWYRAMLESFPRDSEAPANRYLLAEVLYEGERYGDAAIEYGRVAYEYPLHAQSSQAGYASVVAYERQEARLQGAERSTWHRQSIDSGVMFGTSFPEHREAGAVLTKAAENLFEMNEFDRTIEVTRQVLETQPGIDAKRRLTVTTLLAHSLFDRDRYAEAETAYLDVQRLMPPSDPEQPAIVERLAASIYKQAETKKAAGAQSAAVEDFLRVAMLAPTAKVRANAEFDAASLLIAQRAWPRAIDVLQAFRRTHPGHELEPEATRALALAYMETGQSLAAAPEFERVAAGTAENVDVRRAAQWQAAELYESAAAWPSASRAYVTYVQMFPTPFDASMDARQKLVDIAVQTSDEHARTQWLGDIVKADASAGAERSVRSRYLAARATLSLVEPWLSQFKVIRLAVPLDRSLKTKRAAMEKALELYGRALDYEVAEVTTAATFGMAEIYRQLAADLLASERPADLDAAAREQYDVLLEEQAFPFEEQAIDLHQANARRASTGVYDQWVQSSYAMLAKLMPARYAKVELSEDHVAQLH